MIDFCFRLENNKEVLQCKEDMAQAKVSTEERILQPEGSSKEEQLSFQLPEQPGMGSNNNVNSENIDNLSLTGQSN